MYSEANSESLSNVELELSPSIKESGTWFSYKNLSNSSAEVNANSTADSPPLIFDPSSVLI